MVGQFCLFNDVPHKFEIIKEEQELPDQPDDDQQEGRDGESHHDLTEIELLVGGRTDLVNKTQQGDLHTDVTQLNKNVDPVRHS